ncbi:MAG: glycosyltransferase family 39 protein, partial [Chloroflexi bacterium]|nr:glycosyltransferase family 39 protein [Chloroflexota bacterium]
MTINNYQLTVDNLPRHLPFLLILLLHLALSLTYASHVPLGEAPDEPAHLAYARFIARHARLPATLAERQEAGYRSAWPPLYHFLVAGPLVAIDAAPPTRLKSIGDTPRRLIPTNGQTIAAFIHTADESQPWRGLPLAWHLSRLISVALTALAVALTYTIAWQLTGQRVLATSAAALHAFIPQVLFIGSAVNDDNLLICLAGLIYLTLITYPPRSSPRHAFILGALLGLALDHPLSSIFHLLSTIHYPLSSILPFFLGALLTSGWWFLFIWLNFNQVDSLGLLPGSLAVLTTGASDASLRQLTTSALLTFPSTTAWLEWFITLFETFWGSFGGGSAIDLPGWIYGLLSLLCLFALLPAITSCVLRLAFHVSRFTFTAQSPESATIHYPPSTIHHPLSTLFLLSPLFFLPLPILRFILSSNIVETAQGRHLFPALPAIALGLVWGLSRCRSQDAGHTTQTSPINPYTLRFTLYALRFIPLLFPLFALSLSLYSLNLIQASYPPPIPLRTTAAAATATNLLNIKVAESITLVGYEIGQVTPGILPVTLVWRADAIPSDDYLIELTLTGEAGQSLGGWLGHPLGGRYPTRAWDKGDVLRH